MCSSSSQDKRGTLQLHRYSVCGVAWAASRSLLHLWPVGCPTPVACGLCELLQQPAPAGRWSIDVMRKLREPWDSPSPASGKRLLVWGAQGQRPEGQGHGHGHGPWPRGCPGGGWARWHPRSICLVASILLLHMPWYTTHLISLMNPAFHIFSGTELPERNHILLLLYR